jgi:hypothetical protein
MTPRGSTNPAPNQKAAARNAIAPPTRPMGFALSSGLLAEIDRKAKKEKPRAAS